MSDWKAVLEPISEEYLVGLTNKGIVKRAYKDMEQAVFLMKDGEGQLTIQVEEATCTIVEPIGESKCSCPSRSICKHIVMAVLYARDWFVTNAEENQYGDQSNRIENQGTSNRIEDQGTSNRIEDQENNCRAEDPEESNRDNTENPKESDRTGETKESKELIKKQNEGECYDRFKEDQKLGSILSFPYVKLHKTLGEKKIQSLYYKIQQGIWPDIKVTSIVTVYFTETNITVRLLEPVEYSSCTCHKKELCSHKAEAILSYQMYTGILTKEVLASELEDTKPIDFEDTREFAKHLISFLSEQMITGLARSSPTIMDSYESMAIISHNQKLPDIERRLREIKEEYHQYFRRGACFKVDTLMNQICNLYQKAETLSAIQTREEFNQLAGDFRTEYSYIQALTLLGMGQRDFRSKSGYEGETYYFLSEDNNEWYTYTNARPVFYETNRKRTTSDQAMSPWQLPCKLEDLVDAKILLYNGKTSKDNRLSATSEARAEYLGKRKLDKAKLKKQYYEDFLLLYKERLADSWQQEEQKDKEQNLVLIQPSSIQNPTFDAIRQEYTMELYDKVNRLILLRLTYSKTEHYTIKHLERLGKRIEQGDLAVPCFFGVLYIEEGKMKLYPINYYDSSELV